MGCVIGIDGGTESLRAFVFSLEGQVLGSAATPYETRYPHPAWAEQSPDDWWSALALSIGGALAEAGLRGADVEALCVDTTCCSVVALDAEGAPLRPALIWMDVRASQEAQHIATSGDPGLRVNGGGAGPVSAEWMLPKALWLKRNEPRIFSRAAKIGEYQDFLNWHLTGEWTASLNNASIRWHYQSRHGGVQHSLLQAVGLSDLNAKWPATVVPPGEVIGGLTRPAAAHLGLPTSLPVVQGGADAFIGMIGLGVTLPGEMALITGSSHLHLGVTERAVHKAGVWGTYDDAVYPQKPIIEGGQTSTGSVVAWFKRHFAAETDFDALNHAAGEIPAGAEGLVVLDHFQGNRTPHTDPLSRGAITGLTLKHTPPHVFRAILEGICFGTKLIVESFGEAFQARRVVVAGGATRSPLWMQIHADTLGTPLQLTAVPDAPALGCAILAAYGAGRFASIEEGAEAMVRVVSTVEPDPLQVARYEALYPAYKGLYGALKGVRGTQ